VGISRPANQNDVADYVLHAFKKEEINLIDNKMNQIQEAIQKFLLNK
jgi:peptidyl-tRNA hydrolase